MFGYQSFRLICTAVLLTCDTCSLPAQTISYFHQFSTPAMDRAVAVAADPSGIYVIGNVLPAPGVQRRASVRKDDLQGNEIWTQEFNIAAGNPQLIGAAADATGIYIIGYLRTAQSGDVASAFLRKYSAGGGELWTRPLDSSPLAGVAVDTTGVYVADGELHKYSLDGDELWTSQPSEVPGAFGIAVDSTGVYVLGRAASDSRAYFLVRKWDGLGNELWTRDLGTATDPSSNPELIGAAAPTGFLVAGGNGGGTFLRRYDAAGNELWSRPVGTSYSSLYLGGVAADTTGVYLAGFTPLTSLVGQCRSGSGGDSFLRKYSLDGVEMWTRELGTADTTWAAGLAVDASGVYLAGTSGSTQLSGALYLYNVFPTAGSDSGIFLARLDKSAAATAPAGPRIFPDCVVNAASYLGGGVAPGEIVAIIGSSIGPPDLVRTTAGDDTLSTTLAGTRILFDGVPAPLLYVSGAQSSAVVPYGVAGRTSVDVQVEYQGVRSDVVTMPVLASRPGIFSLSGSGQGQGAILNEDGTVNSPSNPALAGSIITMYATGGGEPAAGIVDGQILSGRLPKVTLPVSAIFNISPDDNGDIAPLPGEVLYAGGVSGSVAGLLQVNVRLPGHLLTGDAVPFALVIGDHWEAFQVTLALR